MTIILRTWEIKAYFITATSVQQTKNRILINEITVMNNTKQSNSSEIFIVSVMIFLVPWQVVGVAIASVHLHRIFTVMLPIQLKASSRKPLIGPVKVMAYR